VAVVGLIAVVLVALGVFVVPRVLSAVFGESQSIERGRTVTVTIPDGSLGSDIAKILYDAGVIANQQEFIRTVHSLGAESSMKSGSFHFVAGEDLEDIIRQLSEGSNADVGRLSIAEGLTLDKTASAIESQLGISRDEFLSQAKASSYVSSYPFLSEAQNDSLEGFLYPKTYDFDGQEVSAESVTRAMLDQYKLEVDSLDLDTAQAALKSTYGVSLSDYDILKVASIIEKEAVSESDRPLVSSVIYNRLRADMPIQSDATMGYVTKGEVKAEDLTVESPYNTYLNHGLVPTPICSPSLASIQAAANPPQTNYLYFLIIEENGYSNHTFSETYEQHQQAIEQAKGE
jgi:UPF0755 protein